MRPPEVSYSRSGDVAIAYQVVGDGPTDIVFVRGITGDLLSTWEQPLLVRHVEGLAAPGRVLMLDRRGTGLSDRVREVQSAETTMDDIRAVMDSAGSERAVLTPSSAVSSRDIMGARSTRPETGSSLHSRDLPAPSGLRGTSVRPCMSSISRSGRGSTPASARSPTAGSSGFAVSPGARIAAEAAPGEVLVSSTVKDLVAGSGLQFEDRRQRGLKGIPDAWHLYALARGAV